MLKNICDRRGRRGSIFVMVTLAIPVIIGLVGLAIDGTICYIVQVELSASVDGAALGTGRMLANINQNNNLAQSIANDFLTANFRIGQGGVWGAKFNGTPTITADTISVTKTVYVNASVSIPLLFMRMFQQNSALISASGTATRRDARVILVIDRSGSMDTPYSGNPAVLPALKTYATTFTQSFTENADELGLVVYSNSGVVAYPSYNATNKYSQNLTGGSCPGFCGPDTNFQDGTSNDMVHQIANIQGQNDTNMGDGLALAYIELQKAHERDLAQNAGVDTRDNYVVLFTDGVPNAVSVYVNNPNSDPRGLIGGDQFGNRTPVLQAAMTGCSAASMPDTAGPPYGGAVGKGPIIGKYPIVATVEAQGSAFFQMASWDTTHTSAQYTSASASQTWDNTYVSNPDPSKYGCNQNSATNRHGAYTQYGLSDLTSLQVIPSLDAYGYPLGPNLETGSPGYQYSYFLNRIANQAPIVWDGTHRWGSTMAPQPVIYSNTNNTGSAYQWVMASWNVVDNIASAIRSDANYVARGDKTPMNITIYTVGYTGDGGTDAGLLAKVANELGCNYNNLSCVVTYGPNGVKENSGQFIPASSTSELNDAFSTILSAILRLSE